VLLIGQAEPETGKAFGVPPDILDALAATGRFDLIINEADGSRMRSFKAPASHEPVIPAGTTIVTPVVGVDILGQPLDDEAVHRAALVSQLSGAVMGQPVTAETIVTVMGHPGGGLKNVPARARVIPLLNKVEGPVELTAARRIAAGLLACERVEAVAIGAVQAAADPVTEVHGRTAAVILAAGGSSRFGSPKQLAPWGEQTFIERAVAVALASQARPVIVVLGAEVAQCQALLAGKPVEVVVNRDWPAGQSTSLRTGLAALPANINSAVFLLVDLPGLRPETVDALIQRHRETLAPIVWPEFAGRRGNPILFDRALFPELQQISGDTGGRPLLAAYEVRAERVAVADQGILFDIDYAGDLAKVQKL
jgi:molybdenum cofactor cytidylyltransferase